VNMSVFERVGEFGTLMALGNRSRDVFSLVMLENALVGLIGAVTGVFVGLLMAWALTNLGIEMPPLPSDRLIRPVVSDRFLTCSITSHKIMASYF
ncbi:MAG: FtsX-like permease family protein, partial [Chitinispirillaceae bacterium]|nr:FtsX-like permease family protein [Chitinispirillaceae bacterium]